MNDETLPRKCGEILDGVKCGASAPRVIRKWSVRESGMVTIAACLEHFERHNRGAR